MWIKIGEVAGLNIYLRLTLYKIVTLRIFKELAAIQRFKKLELI